MVDTPPSNGTSSTVRPTDTREADVSGAGEDTVHAWWEEEEKKGRGSRGGGKEGRGEGRG